MQCDVFCSKCISVWWVVVRTVVPGVVNLYMVVSYISYVCVVVSDSKMCFLGLQMWVDGGLCDPTLYQNLHAILVSLTQRPTTFLVIFVNCFIDQLTWENTWTESISICRLINTNNIAHDTLVIWLEIICLNPAYGTYISVWYVLNLAIQNTITQWIVH